MSFILFYFDDDDDGGTIIIATTTSALVLSHQYAAFNSFSNSELCSTLKFIT